MTASTRTAALEAAQAEVARLQREIAAGPCREYGHDWRFIGGSGREIDGGGWVSVPVHTCSKCGDCDYGDNDDAREIIRAAMEDDT